jgi:hypothetical protein
VAGKLHPLLRHAVEVGSLDDFLSVATEIPVAEIVSENVNDVRLPRGERQRKNKGEKGNESFHEIF